MNTREAEKFLGTKIGNMRLRGIELQWAETGGRNGRTRLFRREDVLKAHEQLTAARAKGRRRTPRLTDDMKPALNLSLTPEEKAVVYGAWLAGTLGPTSQWLHAEPPASYRLAFEALQREQEQIETEDTIDFEELMTA